MSADDHLSQPQFFHGTDQHFEPGHVVEPRMPAGHTRYPYTYLTPDSDQAHGFGLLKGNASGKPARVYEVRPVGETKRDPHTPAPALRSRHPLEVVREIELPKPGIRGER